MSTEDLLIEKLLNLLGSDDLEVMIRNIEAERQGMRELHDENNALRIYNRRLRLVVDYALQVFELLEKEAALFLPSRVVESIGKSRNQIALADKAILESKALSEKENSF